ncbi:MAG: hypothetical protein ABR497_06515 [Kiritimatiellia bacterium]|nr:hypothetical protein [Lentisphaerota bacterium]
MRTNQWLLGLCAAMALAAGCRTPPPPPRIDPVIERHVANARNAYGADMTERAADYFKQALDRAHLLGDTGEIARNAYNLAVCLSRMKEWSAARTAWEEADWAFRESGHRPSELMLLQVRIARGAGRADVARQLAAAYLEQHPDGRRADTRRAEFQALLAAMLCDAQDYQSAADLLSTVDPSEINDKLVLADLEQTRARIARQRQTPREAAAAFDQAARLYQTTGQFNAMADCLADAARMHAALGEPGAAAERFYRAALSMRQQARPQEAMDLLELALPLAEHAGDEVLLRVLQATSEPPGAHEDTE